MKPSESAATRSAKVAAPQLDEDDDFEDPSDDEVRSVLNTAPR